jgi:hypothetical protein
MSLLLFQLSDGGVNVMVDTLAMSPDGAPLLLVTKCGVVPHLNLVIAGTGLAQLPDRWRDVVYSRMLARDIDQLNPHAPDGLRNLWGALQAEFPAIAESELTSTVYHFGLSESQGHYVGYAYRSTNDFVSEPLASGFGIKPAPEPPLVLEVPTTLDAWVECASVLRDQQNQRPLQDRIYIGGELIFYTLQNGAIAFNKVHRFSDFESNWLEMNEAL